MEAEACIVCLGDLIVNGNLSPQHVIAAPAFRDPCLVPNESFAVENSLEDIAHLLPCGHNLHNECLKPWVERANSCPICRQNFNVVELRSSLNGPWKSSYAVEDKQQQAEIDPLMHLEEDYFEDNYEPIFEPCLICEAYGEVDEDLLVECEGCTKFCHLDCAGLDDPPQNSWHCRSCQEDAAVQWAMTPSRPRRRTRGPPRRLRRRRNGSPSPWARVWQSVFDRLDLDLDFPFDEETETVGRPEAHRRDFALWQQRLRVAERQGGAAGFRNTATSLHSARDKARTPPAESQEELRAWNAFDKATEIASGMQRSGRNKRKSATASPIEPAPEPARRLKRPRTRRAQDLGETLENVTAETTNGTGRSRASTTTQSGSSGSLIVTDGAGPTFFQSLLKEVESAPGSAGSLIRNRNRHLSTLVLMPFVDNSSPVSPSPESSPTTSNHPSPRARSPSPPSNLSSRPSSPPPLTSRIEPIFVQQRVDCFSPASPSNKLESDAEEDPRAISRSTRASRSRQKVSPASSPERFIGTSPNRNSMSRADKADIQKMVATALKPAYRKQDIDTDEYTAINREVSRYLYDRVGEAGGMTDETERRRWQGIAADVVESAVKRLKSNVTIESV